jgi:glycerate-2-kinase
MSLIRNRPALTDHGNEQARRTLLDVAGAALDRIHPDRTVPAVLDRDGTTLRVGDRSVDLAGVDDVYILGAGKGSTDVAAAALDALGDRVADAVVAEKRGRERDLERVDVLGAGHPLPDDESLATGRRLLRLADAAETDDLVVACITGGASAQCVVPADGLSLSDLQTTTEVLLEAGLPIDEVNAVRKHCSALKGGQLARRIGPATLVTLVVVDEVAGEPWGPTVADATTADDALAVLERHDLASEVPDAVIRHLRDEGPGDPRTPASGAVAELDAETVVLAGAADICEAARDRAAALGYEAAILSTTVEGESRDVARVLRAIAAEVRDYGRPLEPPCILVSGGETTVTVTGDAGQGGPNQEFGLQFAVDAAGMDDVTALALGTDGTDGPTDVAGALVDGSTVPRAEARGLDATSQLDRHDATTLLRQVDDAVDTGGRGTNVMDLRLILVDA